MNDSFWLGFATGVAAAVSISLLLLVVKPWLRLKASGGNGSLLYVLGMRLRGHPAATIIDAYLALRHSGDRATLREVESHYIVNRHRIIDSAALATSLRQQERT